MGLQNLIISADDLGMHIACNRGIRKAAKDGLLTSASLCANGSAFDDAYNNVIPACPQLGIGAHLVLNEGSACAGAVNSLLVAADGRFRYQGVRGWLKLALCGGSKILRAEVATEFGAQIEKILAVTHCDHLDGHMHVQMIPWIFDVVLEVAEKYRIPYIRIPNERANLGAFFRHFPRLLNIGHWLNLQNYCRKARKKLAKKPIKSNSYFYGLMHSGAMTEKVAVYLLQQHRTHSEHTIVEILFHPAIVHHDDTMTLDVSKAAVTSPHRAEELSALLSENLRAIVCKHNFKLTNYGALAKHS